jgi:hypothetical protein
MDETPEPTLASIRIRFSGNQVTDVFHLPPAERKRLEADWRSYLNGLGARGGEYTSYDGDRTVRLSLNFTQIAFTEPCSGS